jgi:glutamate synthase (NADPH/NADH) large chain
MGDGAGILVQLPHKFFARKAKELGFTLPEPGQYGVGHLFLPRDKAWRETIRKIYEDTARRKA